MVLRISIPTVAAAQVRSQGGDGWVGKEIGKRYFALKFLPETRRNFRHAERVSAKVEEIDLQAHGIDT
jgi:hypothetical protein